MTRLGRIGLRALRESLVAKRTLLFVAGSLLYALTVLLVLREAGDREDHNDLFAMITLTLYWQALVPLTAMYFAIASLRDEIASRTIVHLLASPVSRATIWLGKFCGAALAAFCVLAVGWLTAVVFALGAADDSFLRCSRSTLEAPLVPLLLGCPAYAAIGLLFASFFKRPMIAGAVYVVGWEELVGATPGQAGVRSLTVVDAVRTLFYHGVPAAERFRRMQREWRAGGIEDFAMPEPSDAVRALLWLTAIALGLALWCAWTKDYDQAPKE